MAARSSAPAGAETLARWVSVFLATLGLIVAAVATWIAYLALAAARRAQQDVSATRAG